jgi:septum formation protein
MKLILASQSPRRRQLLEEAGYEFEVRTPADDVEAGGPDVGEATRDYVRRLAMAKARDVSRQLAESRLDGLVIACDTVADCDGVILEKPRDRADAEQMLRLLSGRSHEVWSGLCVQHLPSGRARVADAVSRLTMQPLSEPLLKEYLDSGAWAGKSGAFGYQDGLDWLTLTEGTASNVVGLPMDLLEALLREFS